MTNLFAILIIASLYSGAYLSWVAGFPIVAIFLGVVATFCSINYTISNTTGN